MNAGEDFNGREIDAPTSFFLGVAVNPAADDLDYELERFEQKLEAGAQFAMTQVLFDLSYLERVPRAPRRLVPDPAPRRDLLRAQLLSSRCGCTTRCRGSSCPEHVQARLLDAGADAGDTGLAIARELLEASRELRRRRLRHPAVPAAARRARTCSDVGAR